MPGLSEIVFGKKGKAKKLPLTNKMQDEIMKLISEGLTSGKGAFGDIFGGFNEQEFEKGVSQPALKNFRENVLPMVQEKYISGGQVGGSGMQRGLNKAGVDFQSKLAELMYNAQQQGKENKFRGIESLLGKQTVENIYRPSSKGLLHGVVEGLASGAGQAIGSNLSGGGSGSGGAGAAAGAVAG